MWISHTNTEDTVIYLVKCCNPRPFNSNVKQTEAPALFISNEKFVVTRVSAKESLLQIFAKHGVQEAVNQRIERRIRVVQIYYKDQDAARVHFIMVNVIRLCIGYKQIVVSGYDRGRKEKNVQKSDHKKHDGRANILGGNQLHIVAVVVHWVIGYHREINH